MYSSNIAVYVKTLNNKQTDLENFKTLLFKTKPRQKIMDAKPKNWLIESIFTTLCCCLPLGIAGIYYAAQVDTKFSCGDYSGAAESSANAKKMCLIGLCVGLPLTILATAFRFMAER